MSKFIEGQIEMLDERIEAINNSKVMRSAQKLIEERSKLESAKRSLLGAGSRLTGAGGNNVTQDQVALWLAGQEPSSVYEIAKGVGTDEARIRGHLNRGKDTRFTKLADNKWKVRDPEADHDEDEDDD